MSKTGTALVVKFVMTLVFAAATLLLMDGNRWSQVFMVALGGTIINYLVGDLFILPKYGNTTASICDGILIAGLAYIVNLLVPTFRTSFAALVIFAILIAVGEYFFHQYLLKSEKVAP